jgi:hypothetical protein
MKYTNKLTPLTFVDVKLKGCNSVELRLPVGADGSGAAEVGKGNCAAKPRWRNLHFWAASQIRVSDRNDAVRRRKGNVRDINLSMKSYEGVVKP